MSGDTFHVHGPHDHAMEHATEHAGEHGDGPGHHGLAGRSMTNQIALFTAVISTIGAIFSYMGGATQANAILDKNMAAMRKTEASNQWNYYQAKSSKQNLSELAIVLVADEKKPAYLKEVERYKLEKAEIKLAADKLEAEATEWDRRSDAEMHVHHRWAQATTAIQVSIALAAIPLLPQKKWMEIGMFGMGGLGLVVGIAAAFHI
jgi:hypothetical protein